MMDLLPDARRRALQRAYFLRLATVAVLALAAVVVINAVLLLPSYLALKLRMDERTARLAAVEAGLDGEGDRSVRGRIEGLGREAAYFAELASAPKASRAVAAILGIDRTGIALESFSFEPLPEGGARMALSGVASTRETLRAFEARLRGLPYVGSVDLPIGAYASERDIEFSIALTGPFLP